MDSEKQLCGEISNKELVIGHGKQQTNINPYLKIYGPW
jgi:hypothetical protein